MKRAFYITASVGLRLPQRRGLWGPRNPRERLRFRGWFGRGPVLFRLIIGFCLTLLAAAVVFLAPEASAQEFTIFTKTLNGRFDPSCAPANSVPCLSRRGMDPGITFLNQNGLTKTDGSPDPVNCGSVGVDSDDPTGVADCPVPPNGSLEMFIRLGPGEVTGNMHGRIENLKGAECFEMTGNINFEGTNKNVMCMKLGNTNLGFEKFSPKTMKDRTPCVGTQVAGIFSDSPITEPIVDCTAANRATDRDLTATPATDNGFGVDNAGPFDEKFNRDDDFFPGAIEHVGFQFTVDLRWMKTDDPKRCAVHPNIGGAPGTRCTSAIQSVKQVTGQSLNAAAESGFPAGIGTVSAPGAGDQMVHNEIFPWVECSVAGTDQASLSDCPSTTANAGWATRNVGDKIPILGTNVQPRVEWRQRVKDVNFSGLSFFDEQIRGQFNYNINKCAPKTAYPTGRSQTTGDETIAFVGAGKIIGDNLTGSGTVDITATDCSGGGS